ncbi:MAG: hypothetical protein U0871_21525 [Gemmataceae bacterium]
MALALSLLPCFCLYSLVWEIACDAPILDAVDTAREHAASHGYRMTGWSGEPVGDCDRFGGCQETIVFVDDSTDPPVREVTMRLRRAWMLGGWEVVEMTVAPVR